MLPAIEHEAVTNRRWLTEVEMAEAISVSGAAPGGIGITQRHLLGLSFYLKNAAILLMRLAAFCLIALSFVDVYYKYREQSLHSHPEKTKVFLSEEFY